MPETPKRKKIAILGGGMASLTTAFELTNQSDWHARYEITVYQQGWRLGGKGTSGRNVKTQAPYHEPNYRIEEHGLHIFFGFYENAFRLMKQCYDELGYDGPFQSVEDAFKPHDFIVFEEYIKDGWVHWPFEFPRNNLLPWKGRKITSLWQPIFMTLKFMYELFIGSPYLKSQLRESPLPSYQATASWWEQLETQIKLGIDLVEVAAETTLLNIPDQLVQRLLSDPQRWLARLDQTIKQIETTLKTLDFSSEGTFLTLAYQLAKSLPIDTKTHRSEHHQTLLKLLDRFIFRLRRRVENVVGLDDETIKRLTVLDFAYANIRGLLTDGVVFNGDLDALDHYDYKDWLEKNGAQKSTLNSSLVRVLYDLVYAFKDGDIQQPRLAAGIALRIMINVVFKYSGAIMWKMQAGMGDTIFAPLYKVLQRRGVQFKFFHRVKQLHLTDDQTSIASISVGRQVTLKDENQEYDPLIEVKRLLCWPSEPCYGQIVEGEQLQQEQINLESFWTPWQDVEELNLQAGKDFDLVVLGISLAALPSICPELIQANIKWADMVNHVKTVTTQGGQLWLKSNLDQLGWKMPSPVVGTYVEPLDTYADMSQVLDKENWPSEYYPYNVAYFTGVIADPGLPPSNEHDFPAQAKAQVDAQALNFLQNQIGHLWPTATTPENPQGLDWELLVDPENRQGQERYHSQYWVTNINPSERYVLSLPGSTKYRLKADESGFKNLYLTGDWINNGFNSGCIEATVMSGMQAVRAILKQNFHIEYSKKIIGESEAWR